VWQPKAHISRMVLPKLMEKEKPDWTAVWFSKLMEKGKPDWTDMCLFADCIA